MAGSSTSKKVVVYRFDREPLSGFVNPQTWIAASGIELLTPSGAIVTVPHQEVKVVCFVKEFDGNGWREERRVFGSRPKVEGLWVRALFRDNDFLEATMPNELAAGEEQGFLVVPPDAASNTQRAFLPRSALKELKVMGVIGSPARKRKPEPGEQIGLFE